MNIKAKRFSFRTFLAAIVDQAFTPVPRRRLMLGAIDLGDPEVKEAIKAAVEEATAPLIAKRDELLREVKTARKGQQIDPETVTKLEDQIEALKGELSTAQKAAKAATADAEKSRKALEGETAATQRLLVDNGLSAELVKAGVTNPAHLKAVKSMLAASVQVVADGDTRVAKVGDKALGDFIAEWSKSDEGKHFVSAPHNSGGGAGGGAGGGGGKAGDMGGDKAARVAAIGAKFPELNKQ